MRRRRAAGAVGERVQARVRRRAGHAGEHAQSRRLGIGLGVAVGVRIGGQIDPGSRGAAMVVRCGAQAVEDALARSHEGGGVRRLGGPHGGRSIIPGRVGTALLEGLARLHAAAGTGFDRRCDLRHPRRGGCRRRRRRARGHRHAL
jgi:hypothetical protein